MDLNNHNCMHLESRPLVKEPGFEAIAFLEYVCIGARDTLLTSHEV